MQRRNLSQEQALNDFLRKLSLVKQEPGGTELSDRFAFQKLFDVFAEQVAPAVAGTLGMSVLHEPGQQKNRGAPDFWVRQKDDSIVGYVECKRPESDLRTLLNGAQIRQYLEFTNNLLFTNGLHWMLLCRGEHGKARVRAEASLAALADLEQEKPKATPEALGDTASLLEDFFRQPPLGVASAEELAQALALRCRRLKQILEEELAQPEQSKAGGHLNNLLEAFRKDLAHDLSPEKFCDSMAQTLVYALFLARLHVSHVTLREVESQVPRSFPVIRDLVNLLRHLDESKTRWLTTELLAVVNGMDEDAIRRTLSFKNKAEASDEIADPYLYFYEDFLKAYDPKLRQSRGVYYTPPEVVRFIIRAAEDALRNILGRPQGLADTNVKALDFASGTGAFLLEIMRCILAGKSQVEGRLLVREHILQHCYGFEYLVAPYAVAHLKLSQFLDACGHPLEEGQRVPIYLTNTLVPNISEQTVFSVLLPALAEETTRAEEIKKEEILLITGNPPYNVKSQNKGAWIVNLIQDYTHQIDQGKRNESLSLLHDDYVKFIRFAEEKMEKVKQGIVAVITNHGFLDNVTFRGMRKHLLNTFDQLYFLDLHGNSRRKEIPPQGIQKDENVFDIQQGVAISILIKKEGLEKRVYYAELWGSREHKNAQLASYEALHSVSWNQLDPQTPYYWFIPRNETHRERYEEGIPIRSIFPEHSVGIKTAKDKIAIAFDKASLEKRIQHFLKLPVEDARNEFSLGPDTKDWKVHLAQDDLRKHDPLKDYLRRIVYRPFDLRFTYYTGKSKGFYSGARGKFMGHMLRGENLGLIMVQQFSSAHFNHVFITNSIIVGDMTPFTSGYTHLFPLYLYPSPTVEAVMPGEAGLAAPQRVANISSAFCTQLGQRLGHAPTPEAILGYIYGVLHAPCYRERYDTFLRYDFPRVPWPPHVQAFDQLAALGQELIQAHLLRGYTEGPLARYDQLSSPDSALTAHVLQVRDPDAEQRVFINPHQYFAPIPQEVWDFRIGGYQPLKHYLKSRQGRTLSLEDINTLRSAANALQFTLQQMHSIDAAVQDWL